MLTKNNKQKIAKKLTTLCRRTNEELQNLLLSEKQLKRLRHISATVLASRGIDTNVAVKLSMAEEVPTLVQHIDASSILSDRETSYWRDKFLEADKWKTEKSGVLP